MDYEPEKITHNPRAVVVVCDATFYGKRKDKLGTLVFKDYPIQMCHVHQRKTINRYLTRNPKLEASKDLQKIMYSLISTTQTKHMVLKNLTLHVLV